MAQLSERLIGVNETPNETRRNEGKLISVSAELNKACVTVSVCVCVCVCVFAECKTCARRILSHANCIASLILPDLRRVRPLNRGLFCYAKRNEEQQQQEQLQQQQLRQVNRDKTENPFQIYPVIDRTILPSLRPSVHLSGVQFLFSGRICIR